MAKRPSKPKPDSKSGKRSFGSRPKKARPAGTGGAKSRGSSAGNTESRGRKKTATSRPSSGKPASKRGSSSDSKPVGSRPKRSSNDRPKRASSVRPKSAFNTRPKRTSNRPKRGSTSISQTNPELIRLQRVLAAAGFGSRRECETLIEEGRVIVDGEVVSKLGSRVNPQTQKITVDGQKVIQQQLEYFILNKPPGVVSTSRDPSGRPRVIDLIDTRQRVYNVGRLDKASEGLILVTNDGDLANQLTHPRYGVAKTYLVQVEGEPSRETLASLREGMYLAEGFAKVANVQFKRRQKSTSWLEIVLEEGRNREIRRLLSKVGHKVLLLRRIAIGPVRLGELPVGAHRPLDPREIKALRMTIATGKPSAPRRKPSQKTTTSGAAFQKKTSTSTRAKTTSGSASKTTKGSAYSKSKSMKDLKKKPTSGSFPKKTSTGVSKPETNRHNKPD